MTLSRWYSTRFGLRTTRLPASGTCGRKCSNCGREDVGEVGVVVSARAMWTAPKAGGCRRAPSPRTRTLRNLVLTPSMNPGLGRSSSWAGGTASPVAGIGLRALAGQLERVEAVRAQGQGRQGVARHADRPAVGASASRTPSRMLLVELRQDVGDGRVVGVAGQGELRPAEVFQVGHRQRRPRPGTAGAAVTRGSSCALQRQQHDRRRAGDRLGHRPEHLPVAVVDPAGVERPVEQQLDPLDDPRVVAPAGGPQGQARPRRSARPRRTSPRPTASRPAGGRCRTCSGLRGRP